VQDLSVFAAKIDGMNDINIAVSADRNALNGTLDCISGELFASKTGPAFSKFLALPCRAGAKFTPGS